MPHLKKTVTFKQKIRLRKQLNADALFGSIRQKFEKIPEFRTGEPNISIHSDPPPKYKRGRNNVSKF